MVQLVACCNKVKVFVLSGFPESWGGKEGGGGEEERGGSERGGIFHDESWSLLSMSAEVSLCYSIVAPGAPRCKSMAPQIIWPPYAK